MRDDGPRSSWPVVSCRWRLFPRTHSPFPLIVGGKGVGGLGGSIRAM
jgi:hypothetical protein